MIRVGGVATAVVAAATAGCGLLMVGGVAPSPAAHQLTGDSVAAAPTTPDSSSPDRSTPDTTTPDTTTPDTTTPDTTTPDSTTTTTVAPVSNVPLSVSPDAVTVGAGGTARISGTCPVIGGVALGPVEIWEVGADVRVVATGVTAADWSYDWTAPSVVAPLVLQVWCGAPGTAIGGYPAEFEIEVVFVAQEPQVPTTPAPTATTTTVAAGAVIPETG